MNKMSVETPTIEGRGVSSQSERNVELEEIAELETPIRRIIEKIRDRIENDEYGLIIGDDASGRIPALILGNFIKKVSEFNGLDNPDIIFIPGKLHLHPMLDSIVNVPELKKHLSKFKAIKDKRILIVTDTVLSGNSLAVLVGLLRKIGFTCDIATVGVETEEKDVADRNKKLQNSEVISGEYYNEDSINHNTPKIYKNEILNGVYKRSGGKVSKTLKSSALPEGTSPEDVNPESINTDSSRQEIQESINQSRKDVNLIVDHLIDWYESQKHEE